MARKFSISLVWKALKASAIGFSDHKITKLSASLSYYTVFSLGPLLIVIIYVSSIFLGREVVEGSLYAQMQAFIGHDAAKQIETIIKNASISGKSGMAATIGIITLLIGATTVFGEIQDSINSIWGVKAKPRSGIMRLLMTRLLSFGIVASLGFLLLVSLAVTAVVEALGARLQAYFPDMAVIVIYILNLILSFGVITLLFAIIYKVLPDIRIGWRSIWPGAIAAALIFMVAKFGISLYISKTDVGSTYGAAGSLVVLIIWVYFSSFILFFGAEFTRAYALERGEKIVPDKDAVWDEKPAIAGAKPSSKISSGKPPSEEGSRKRKPLPIPKRANASMNDDQGKKENKAGFGTLLAGLILYFINSERGKEGD